MTGTTRGWATALAVAIGVLCGPLAPCAHADGESDGDRMRRLEEALARQAAEIGTLRREVERWRGEATPRLTQDELHGAIDAYLAASTPEVRLAAAPPRGLRWGGYLSLEYVDDTAGNSFFDVHRLILSAEGAIADRIDFATEIEIEHGGISDEIEGEIVLEKAEVSFAVSDAVNPKVGWLLVPFARFNSMHDDPLNDFTIRPFTARFLVPTGFGQPGIGVFGAAPFGRGHVLTYDVALTNGYRDAFTADEGVRAARQDRDENDGKQVWARAVAAWDTHCVLDRLETGLSGTYGLYDARDENAITGWALDFLVRKGPFEVKGEYVAYDYERDSAAPPDAIEHQDGIWLEAAYHFFPGFLCGGCPPFVEDTSLFTLAVRWQRMDLDDHVRGATFQDDLEAWSVGLNYRITERSVFRLDHTWFDAEEADDERQWAASFSTYL
jgi:hypothetical protein